MRIPFLAVPRAVLGTDWWREATPLTRNLWLVLFSRANWQPGITRAGEMLQPGQLVTSWASLAEELGWLERGRRVIPTIAKCRRAADFLKSAGEAAWEPTGVPTSSGILVTLVKWEFYAGRQDDAADVATGVAAEGSAGTPATLKIYRGSAGSGRGTEVRRQLQHHTRRIEESRLLLEAERKRQRGDTGGSND